MSHYITSHHVTTVLYSGNPTFAKPTIVQPLEEGMFVYSLLEAECIHSFHRHKIMTPFLFTITEVIAKQRPLHGKQELRSSGKPDLCQERNRTTAKKSALLAQ